MAEGLLLAAFSGGLVYLAMWLALRKRERLQQQQAESEARFRTLTELSADWFWETDAEQRVVWLSGGGPVAMLFGSGPLYGKRFWEAPGIEVDAHALRDHHERLARGREFFDLELARTDERGARQVHIISGQCRRNGAGEVLGYRGVGRDVTLERRAEQSLASAKERLEMALDGGNLAEWHLDLESDALFAGDGWIRFLGHEVSPSLTRGSQVVQRVHPDDMQAAKGQLVRVLKGELQHYDAELRVAMRGNAWKWMHVRARVSERNAAGRAKRLSGVVADVDERKRAQAALAERDQRFRDVAEAAGEYVWETDADGCFTYLSDRVEAVLGYAPTELLGRNTSELLPLGEERAMREWLTRREAWRKPFRDLVTRAITKSGRVIWQSLSAVPMHDAAGAWAGYRGTAADVTARKQAEERIEYLSTRDPLTALANRGLLAERAGQAIADAARSRSRLALLCIDLDRFRLVNESLGHPAGDALLRAVAERLNNALRREDVLARLGADHFVLLWNGLRSDSEAETLAQRLLAVLGRPFTVDGRTVGAGASIGVALYPEHGRGFTELLKNADAAMAYAKEHHRGAWRFYDESIGAAAASRLRVENDLRGALARSELVLHWHPVLRGSPGAIVGAEALVRWQHPERGLLLPEEFVPLAEASGLIGGIGTWTLERALSQAGAWQRRLPGFNAQGPWFAVNTTATELAEGEGFVRRLQGALAANGLEGSRIELEVTERALVADLERNCATLRSIGELGVRLSIDDFGTGYSSLAYLRRLPIHKLKIDRMFLRGIAEDAADRAIVRTIASLARTLGIAVAAEGVENAAQLHELMQLGCEHWQGHYFSEPVDAAGFEALFSASAYSGPGTSASALRGGGTRA